MRWSWAWYALTSVLNCASASARPGAWERIAAEFTYPNFGTACAAAEPATTAHNDIAINVARTKPLMNYSSVRRAGLV